MASIEERLFWAAPARQPETREEIVVALAPEVRAIMADELCAIADGTRSTEVLFLRDDGSGVKYGYLLRERATALRSQHC